MIHSRTRNKSSTRGYAEGKTQCAELGQLKYTLVVYREGYKESLFYIEQVRFILNSNYFSGKYKGAFNDGDYHL